MNMQFNVDVYSSCYGDVAAACGSNIAKIYEHYINYGYKEGRTLTTMSDADSYNIKVYSFATGAPVNEGARDFVANVAESKKAEAAKAKAESSSSSDDTSSSSSSSSSSSTNSSTTTTHVYTDEWVPIRYVGEGNGYTGDHKHIFYEDGVQIREDKDEECNFVNGVCTICGCRWDDLNNSCKYTINSISIDPASADVTKGAYKEFVATANGTGTIPNGMTWSVNSIKSTIEANGIDENNHAKAALYVGLDEDKTSLTITATSSAKHSKSGTATVTVNNPSPTVTSVTVTPNTASVNAGNKQQFSATVNGENNPSQSVNWSITGSEENTTISQDGLLTVASDEKATTITVKATSTVDDSKNGTATVTVNGQT